MGFSRQEYCSVLPCPPAGDLPNLETESASLMSHVLTGRFFTTSSTWEAPLKGEVAQSCLTLCDPMAAAQQAPVSMGFSRQEYWSGLPFPPLGDLPNPGVEPTSPVSPALAGGFFTN